MQTPATAGVFCVIVRFDLVQQGNLPGTMNEILCNNPTMVAGVNLVYTYLLENRFHVPTSTKVPLCHKNHINSFCLLRFMLLCKGTGNAVSFIRSCNRQFTWAVTCCNGHKKKGQSPFFHLVYSIPYLFAFFFSY